jgi:hypothetical protein
LIPSFSGSWEVRNVILAGTLGRATASWSLVIDLVRVGYGIQASMIVRSLFEDAEVAHWIVTYRGHDEVLGRLFDDHDDLQNLRLARSRGEDRPAYMGAERAGDLWRRYGKNPGSHWTRKSQGARLRAVRSAWWGQGARRDQLELLTQTAQMVEVWNNAMLHHGPWAIRPFVRPGENGDWLVTTGATWHRGWAPLDLGYMSYGLLLYLCAEHFGDGHAPTLRAFLPDAVEVRRLRFEVAEQESRREAALRASPPPIA